MSKKSIPLWLSISHQIEEDIEKGRFSNIDMLPTEMELCDIYNASRITIRGAMTRLVDLGKVKRIKGKGTIINRKKIEAPLLKIVGFSKEMYEKGIIPSTSYAKIEKKSLSGYVNELFNMPKGTEFSVLERLRCTNDVPLGYFVTYINPQLKLSLNSDDYYTSLYDIFSRNFNVTIDFVQQTICAEIPDKRTREMLNLLPGEPVMVMKRWGYSKGVLIEYSVCKYDSKRYEYKFELKDDKI